MSFWRRKREREREATNTEDTAEDAITERDEQKRRSLHADKEFYQAMRRFALEAGDARGVRHYSQELADLETLEYELEVLSDERRGR